MAPRKSTKPEPHTATEATEIAPPATDAPKLPHEIAMQMKEAGMSDEVIQAALTAQFGGGDGQGAAPATPGAGEQVGPDPQYIAAYQERMKNYVPPKTDFKFCALRRDDDALAEVLQEALQQVDPETAPLEDVVEVLLDHLHDFGGITLPKWALEWCVQWQYWQMTIRRMPEGKEFTQAMALADMVRHHWHNHPQERAQLRMAKNPNVKTGPANSFSPAAGTWSS